LYNGIADGPYTPRPVCYLHISKVLHFMYLSLYVEPQDVSEAQILMDQFGMAAGIEAAERAMKSRNVGNHLHYCRWRQIERLIIMLSIRTTFGTVH
jgi:hypothetical protein